MSAPALSGAEATGNSTRQGQKLGDDEVKNNRIFPLGYKDGFCQWWANMPAAVAERRVLSFIPRIQRPPAQIQTGSAPPSTTPSSTAINEDNPEVVGSTLPDPYGPRRWTSALVQLQGKNRALNEFSVERIGEKTDNNLVMLHGYGAGLGFFYRNFEPLSRARGWRIYALDMLGMGRSSRPPFKIHAKDHDGKIAESEDWFIDALEEWRITKKIDRFTLLGHSMGGYMATAYALKYPGHLNKLILASPVGIPEDPFAVSASFPDGEDGAAATNEFIQEQKSAMTPDPSVPLDASTNGDQATRPISARSQSNKSNRRVPRRPLPRWVTYLWDANFSPFSIVRWAGPFGPRFVSAWTSRRFSQLPAAEAEALHDYAYSLFRQRGSGEYVLAYILAPGAFARSPLIRRIQGVGRQVIKTAAENNGVEVRERGVPVVMMYGDHDWMDIAGGYAAEAKLNDERDKWTDTMTEAERRADKGSAKVVVIHDAGHHVYLDGWQEFNEIMLEEMAEVSRDSGKT